MKKGRCGQKKNTSTDRLGSSRVDRPPFHDHQYISSIESKMEMIETASHPTMVETINPAATDHCFLSSSSTPTAFHFSSMRKKEETAE